MSQHIVLPTASAADGTSCKCHLRHCCAQGILDLPTADPEAALASSWGMAFDPSCSISPTALLHLPTTVVNPSRVHTGSNSLCCAQHWSEAALRETLGFDADVAAKLQRLCRGVDDTPVAERPPPKTLSVQVRI